MLLTYNANYNNYCDYMDYIYTKCDCLSTAELSPELIKIVFLLKLLS